LPACSSWPASCSPPPRAEGPAAPARPMRRGSQPWLRGVSRAPRLPKTSPSSARTLKRRCPRRVTADLVSFPPAFPRRSAPARLQASLRLTRCLPKPKVTGSNPVGRVQEPRKRMGSSRFAATYRLALICPINRGLTVGSSSYRVENWSGCCVSLTSRSRPANPLGPRSSRTQENVPVARFADGTDSTRSSFMACDHPIAMRVQSAVSWLSDQSAALTI
jgi:hypothetical protein